MYEVRKTLTLLGRQMKIVIRAVFDVEPANNQILNKSDIAESVRQAIRYAIWKGEENGHVHSMENKISIVLEKIEVI